MNSRIASKTRLPRRGLATIGTALIFAFMLSLGSTSGAIAAPPTVEEETTTKAEGNASACTSENDCVSAYVGAGSPLKFEDGASMYVEFNSAAGQEHGSALVTDSYWIDQDALSSAGFGPTSVDLYTYVCDAEKNCDEVYSRTVTIAATWTGSGNPEANKYHYRYDQGRCTVDDKIDSLYDANASLELIVDGSSLTGGGPTQVNQVKTRTTCH